MPPVVVEEKFWMVTGQMVLIAEKAKLLWFSSNHFVHDTERLICSRASIRLHHGALKKRTKGKHGLDQFLPGELVWMKKVF